MLTMQLSWCFLYLYSTLQDGSRGKSRIVCFGFSQHLFRFLDEISQMKLRTCVFCLMPEVNSKKHTCEIRKQGRGLDTGVECVITLALV